jgi:hypothetical protein
MCCQVSGLIDIVDHTINRMLDNDEKIESNPSLSPVADIVRRTLCRQLEDKVLGVSTSRLEEIHSTQKPADDFQALS